jgi:HlyD family secretion protein
MNLPRSSQFFNLRTLALTVAATTVAGATIFYGMSQFKGDAKSPEIAPETTTVAAKVAALGRLKPASEVIKLSVPAPLKSDRVLELNVEEGDSVREGETIAILDSHDRLQAALAEAQEQVQVAQAKLEQVKAGAKAGEIAAQAATVNRTEAQIEGDAAAQQAAISRIQAQWEGERSAQEASLNQIQAQWEGERSAQEASIARLVAESKNAEAEYRRYESLVKSGATSELVYDTKRLVLETSLRQVEEARANLDRINRTAGDRVVEAQANLDRINGVLSEQLNEAQVTFERIENTGSQQMKEAAATLDRIAEVRPVDIQAAQAEVDRAIAAVNRTQADLEQTYIKAPKSGQVLKIHTYPGEEVSEDGILELGETQEMEVVAEVYQTDIGKVKTGQRVTITSQAFDGELQGTVKKVGLQVLQQKVFKDEPGENLDRRVIEVKIRLNADERQKVAGLTNLQVQVAIETEK